MGTESPESGQNSGRKVLDVEILRPEPGSESANRRNYGKGYATYGYWSQIPIYRDGCLGPAITFALFLICLGKYGLLAAIGFLVFYAIGSVIGTVHSARMLIAGRLVNPWMWRTGSWLISFVLTVWLAGGFKN